MHKQLLLGAEAIAQAALDAGISGVYAYPGTPSTEITEYIQQSVQAKGLPVRSAWATNEKTAFEAALGMSYAGKRSLTCMKHVGLNVAADAFMNASVTGVHGGVVLAVADDPSMHSSQNEQDSRVYGKFAMIPVLEPANHQETYDMVRYGFDLSEKTELPVMLRIPTRLSHSRAAIRRREARQQNELRPSRDKEKWILLPANARKNYLRLLGKQQELAAAAELSEFNRITEGENGTGIIAFGIAYNYAMEVVKSHRLNIPVLKISQYPLPEKKIREFAGKHVTVLVAEEGYPVYEELLKGYFGNGKFRGRLDGALPRTGELSPNLLAKALLADTANPTDVPAIVAARPPMLCKGCSHRDLFDVINRVTGDYPESHLFGDIGCYTLGALPPYNAISTCVDMGASITMAKGAADAGMHPAICVIGDSTFTHSGMTGLLDAVNDRSPITVIISDNGTTAMTGGQNSTGTGRFYDICRGIGVEESHIRSIEPLKKNLENNVSILKEEIDYQGVSVIIAQRECVQTAKKTEKRFKRQLSPVMLFNEKRQFRLARCHGSMNKNIIIAGVGGQGILTIASIIDLAAMNLGLHVKQAEVHGMSQRGGAVEAHLRISSEEIFSDLIPIGTADLILSIEPMEALRHLPFLSPRGVIVTATEPYKNISGYPDEEKLMETIRESAVHLPVEAESLAKKAGSPKTFNVVMLGAASPYLPIGEKELEKAIGSLFERKGKEIVNMNITAFRLGKDYASQ